MTMSLYINKKSKSTVDASKYTTKPEYLMVRSELQQ